MYAEHRYTGDARFLRDVLHSALTRFRGCCTVLPRSCRGFVRQATRTKKAHSQDDKSSAREWGDSGRTHFFGRLLQERVTGLPVHLEIDVQRRTPLCVQIRPRSWTVSCPISGMLPRRVPPCPPRLPYACVAPPCFAARKRGDVGHGGASMLCRSSATAADSST